MLCRNRNTSILIWPNNNGWSKLVYLENFSFIHPLLLLHYYLHYTPPHAIRSFHRKILALDLVLYIYTQNGIIVLYISSTYYSSKLHCYVYTQVIPPCRLFWQKAPLEELSSKYSIVYSKPKGFCSKGNYRTILQSEGESHGGGS